MSRLHRPRALPEALAHLAEDGARVIAGGTDVFPGLVDRAPPRALVDLSMLPELRGITRGEHDIRIGAATRWSEIACADLPPALGMLQQAAREIGARQIQNRATVGGNLCNASPAADGAPPLLALDARVELAALADDCVHRRTVPLADFLLGNRRTALAPREIMTAILVPRADESAGSAFLKLGARRYLVISIIMVAALVAPDEKRRIRAARVAVGAASAVARRFHALERRLVGASLDEDLSGRIDEDDFAKLSPIDDMRATAAYRFDAARTCVARALRAAASAA